MSNVSEIFQRLDIQHIREFLLNGVECAEISNKSYKQRIDEARTPAVKIIKKQASDIAEYAAILREVNNYVDVVKDVYMEIGIQCGAIIAMQLLGNDQLKQIKDYD
jgi:hypothetical protein